ncbi:SAICAR synthase-like protein [Pluteus cervinus]|uniref:SAICAR synthase-like protein n=1 Tax=Pluteus cervinus TaxID=181527 RepID=A0ACD3A9X8_9AGAR|nr:SAICAR synthase-like protein [Pluteus cervinus]
MSTADVTADVSHAQPLSSQVGGHAGVLSTEDGSLIIKPALHRELEFYQHLTTNDGFADLIHYVPKFLGTLQLQGKVDTTETEIAHAETERDGDVAVVTNVEAHVEVQKESIVLENISHTFLKPNILDIKLGTVLYAYDASEEKKARMEKTARETTSFETGVRLTGFQVYDNTTSVPINTPKSYGKSIKPSDLPDGISNFFPLPSPGATPNQGLPPHLLLPILHNLLADIQEIREVLSKIEMRMAGGSLLIVYEADWERAEEGIKKFGLTTKGREVDFDEEEEEDSDAEDSDENENKVGPPYSVKLIDFAHTFITPGEGPDPGVLVGVDTTLALLKGRIEQVTQASA